jgi:hypothetical protein
MAHHRQWPLLFVVLGAAAGGGDEARPVNSLWATPKVPFDPVCADCPVADRMTMSHAGGTIEMRYHPAVDDPVVQWAACLDAALGCAEKGGTLPSCVASAPCPEPCRAAYAATAGAHSSERRAQFAAFEDTFIKAGAQCRPVPEVAP